MPTERLAADDMMTSQCKHTRPTGTAQSALAQAFAAVSTSNLGSRYLGKHANYALGDNRTLIENRTL